MLDTKIDPLLLLKNKRKFASDEWLKRGLNPSNHQICDLLESNIDICIDQLVDSIQENKSQRELKKVLSINLKKLGPDLDTEEKEFAADLYFQISKILDIDFKSQLNKWLHGSILMTLIKITELFRGKEKVIETIENNCTKCNAKLDTFILEKMDANIQNDYNIVKCNNCAEYNLLDNGQGNKRIQFGNYELVEQLSKNAYNQEDAEIRLKQIKVFRK